VAELFVGAVLVTLLVRVLGEGDSIELDDVLGVPQLAATLALLGLGAYIGISALRQHGAEEHQPVAALALFGVAASGWLLILFPERMPDTLRGGMLMTAFWFYFGWLLLAIAYAFGLSA
jgi:hypothetical protein